MGRRIEQIKSFWFDTSKVFPPQMDQEVNAFLKNTPGIICTLEDFPDIQWGEVGHYVICNVTYRSTTTHKIIGTNSKD